MIDAPVDTVDGFVRARPHARCVRAPQNAVTTNTRSSSVTLPDGRGQLQPQSPPMLGTFASTVGRTPLSRFKPHNSTASAANASGFVQTALSGVTRRTIFALRSTNLRRVTPDRVISLPRTDPACVRVEPCPVMCSEPSTPYAGFSSPRAGRRGSRGPVPPLLLAFVLGAAKRSLV